jgi:thioredoxin-like negative regulator of GroEL
MGFLGGLFQKKQSAADPLEALRAQVEARPKDPKPARELALALKARGDLSEAVTYALVAATAHKQDGFPARALSELKVALSWGEPSAELLLEMVELHLAMKHKEDARGVLLKLRELHVNAGNTSERDAVDQKLVELGPGR